MSCCNPRFFDAGWYLEQYPDVARSGTPALKHYARHGRFEGRLPCFMVASMRERDLRWGFLAPGREDLAHLASEARGADRIWAIQACARSAVRRGDWAAAAAWLRGLDPERDIVGGFCREDDALLAIEVFAMTGERVLARGVLDLARRAFGNTADLRLAHANLLRTKDGFGADWHRVLWGLYARHWSVGIRVAPGDGPAFDRLQGARRPWSVGRSGPLVTVVMPARDAGATIATALRSLCAQSWFALEILVVDNGSRDATRSVVRRMAGTDPRIRLLDGGHVPGAYAARNLGVARATGAFITVLDADDWAHPERIARQVRVLLRRGSAAASLSSWVRVTDDLRFTRWWKDAGHVHPDLSSLMIRTELRDRLGFWDRVRVGADTEYHDRILHVLGAQAVAEVAPGLPLCLGRQRAGSLTQDGATSIASHVYGARWRYRNAARRWHARLRQEDLPLPAHPVQRPFSIPEDIAVGDPPAVSHASGWLEASGFWDDAWYMRTYPDLRARDCDGVGHYLEIGAAEGRDPGPGFSTSGYTMAHGPFTRHALEHYLDIGRAQGAAPLPVWSGDLAAPRPGRHVLVFGHQAGKYVFGAERCLLDLLSRAAEEGYTPSVVLPHIMNAWYLSELCAHAHKVHVIPYGWVFGGVAPAPETVARLATLIRDSAAVEVHQNTLVLDAPLAAATVVGVPSVVHVHELPAEDPQLCMDLGLTSEELRRRLQSQATRCVANSAAVRAWLGMSRERCTVLPNRIDPDLFALPFAPADPPRVALIGSLTLKKGIRDFVSVAHAVQRAGHKAEFLLIGPSSDELAALGRLPANMRHVGYADGPIAAMLQADIVVSLSQVAESFGLTVFEAMAAGRPVICYDSGTPPALVGTGGGGHVVPFGSIDGVVQALATLLKGPAPLEAASRLARSRGAELRHEHMRAGPIFGTTFA